MGFCLHNAHAYKNGERLVYMFAKFLFDNVSSWIIFIYLYNHLTKIKLYKKNCITYSKIRVKCALFRQNKGKIKYETLFL